jgi:hypothetical protein
MSETTTVVFFGKKKKIDSDGDCDFKHGKMVVNIQDFGASGYEANANLDYANGFQIGCTAEGKTAQKALAKLEKQLIKGITALQKFLG